MANDTTEIKFSAMGKFLFLAVAPNRSEHPSFAPGSTRCNAHEWRESSALDPIAKPVNVSRKRQLVSAASFRTASYVAFVCLVYY